MTKQKHPSAAGRARQSEKLAARERRIRIRNRRTLIVAAVGLGLLIGLVIVAIANSRDSQNAATPPRSNSSLVPSADHARGHEWNWVLETNRGDISIVLDGNTAPQAAAVLLTLNEAGFFASTDCHRLRTEEPYFLQCGSPDGTAAGGPPYRFGPVENAPADDRYLAGSVVMVRSSDDEYSMGSQFFIVYEDSTIESTDGRGYTVVGRVTQGLDIVRHIAEGGTITGASDGQPAQSVILTKVATA